MTTIASILNGLGPIDPVVKHRRRRSLSQDMAANRKAWRTRRRMKAAQHPETGRFASLPKRG